jgi:acyl transferase domain-containing protein
MALGLYRSRPAFRHALDRCAEALLPLLNFDLRSLLYPSPSGSDAAAKQLQQTFFAQPALFIVEYALAQMWMEWGVRPVVMLGHSLGEYVAACMAGVLKLEDALRLIAARARLMQPLAGGAMLAVALGEAEVMGLARHGLSVAALNGTQQSVLSGRASAIAGVEEKLRATGVECRRLPTEHAFHSPMMEAMIPEFREELRKVTWSEPQLKYVSNVSGRMVLPEEAMSEEYWVEHVRRTVRFSAGVEELERRGVTVILEVGPGEALSRLAKRQHDGAWREVVATLPAQKPEQTQAEIKRREAEDDIQLQRAAGKLWTTGVDIDWSAFHQPAHPHRVALPTYPFQRERFWIDDAPRQARASAAVGKQPLETWFYLPSWKRTLPPPMLSVEELSEFGAWIILADSRGVGEELGQRLREMGQLVVLAEQGERYERLEAERYRVRAGEREDYEKLLAGVMQSAAGAEVAEKRIKVVHLWNLDEKEEQGSEQPAQADGGLDGWAEFERAQTGGYYSLLALAQVVENAGVDVPLSIIAAASQLHSITSEEISLPYRATMLGPCRVIPQEYKNITCRLVDVGSGKRGSVHRKRLINQLLSESADGLSEVAVAYRGEQRWVQSFEPVDWTTNRATGRKLRAGGVYLILGGLEDTGQLLAQHLWETAGAKLMLTSKRGLPPREQWQTRQLEWLIRMEQQGAELEVLQADVSDEEELGKVVAQIDGRWGDLHGVVYAAESRVEMSFSPVGSTGRAESDGQFRSKARTLLALEKVLQNRELDFCMIVSSLSNILGGPGYVAQAAANAFISSFVFNHNRRNPVWRNVCWDGLRVEEPKAPGAIDNARRSHFGMTTEEGGETFKRILALETATELIVSTENLQARIEQGIDSESLRESGKTRAAATTLHPRPKLPSTYVAPASELERAIANVWQQALGIEQVGVEDSFFELGGDSLIAVRVIADLKRELKQEIPVVSLYEGLTIKSLVSLLQSNTQQLDTVQAEDREERTMRRKLYQQKQRFKKKEAVH